jgi:REP element-mobilizing transposase RayT
MVMPDHLPTILALGDGVPSLSKIMQWFKAQSTARYARAVQEKGWERFAGRLWQRGVYDRVIRTDEELHAIHEYVVTHLQRWALRHEGQ